MARQTTNKDRNMRVLVTGHRGYIGSVVTAILRHRKCDVVGIDAGYFEGADFGQIREEVPSFHCGIRDVSHADLLSFDAIVHLASLPEPNDEQGLGKRAAALNLEITERLGTLCRQAGVGRLIFASTCDVYRAHAAQTADENTPPDPCTPEAETKLTCETALRRLADEHFSPVILRIGDVYGASPRLRLDSPVNDLVAGFVAQGQLRLNSKCTAWRPLVHVEDVARAITAAVCARNVEQLTQRPINIVANDQCYRILQVADELAELFAETPPVPNTQPDPWPSIRAESSYLEQVLPKAKPTWTLDRGLRQLVDYMSHGGMTPSQHRSDRYRRAHRFLNQVEQGTVDPELRIGTTQPVA